jgi:hypothetical protein
MAKLQAKNPLTGNNISLNPMNLLGLVLGGVVLWGVVATSQNVAKQVTDKVNNRYIDLVPNALSQEVKVVNQKNTLDKGDKKMKRRSALIAADFQSGDVACTGGQFTEIGRYAVKAGQYMTLGWGFSASQSDADGRIFMNVKNTSDAAITGKVLISIFTPEDRHYADLFEDRTENLNTSATDRTKQLPFPEMMQGFGKDWIYKIFFKPDSTATVDNGHTVLVASVTVEPKY